MKFLYWLFFSEIPFLEYWQEVRYSRVAGGDRLKGTVIKMIMVVKKQEDVGVT